VADRIPKIVLVAGVLMGTVLLGYLAYFRPGYFTSQSNLGALVFLEMMAVAVCMYRRVFFPVVIVTFLLAGVNLPVGSVWTATRWGVLAAGAVAGTLIMLLRDRRYNFGLFHMLALFAVLAALVSAAVSRYTNLSLLKVLSLFLLFAYTSTGARLAVKGRENLFFSGLVKGVEIFVGVMAVLYLAGIEAMGNPNSLGAVMAVVASPILLWGVIVSETRGQYRRRLALFAVSFYLIFASHSRASMAAAFVACGLLCLALKKYRLLIQGAGIMVILIATLAILQPQRFSRYISSFTSTVVYKGKDPKEGLLFSRKSPWQDAMDSIDKHFWFGTGFGTADNGRDATEDLGTFASSMLTSAERGSSYLAIVTWVGMAGILPFLLLVCVLLKKILEALAWMRRTANPLHPVVPLAAVLLAGLIHAGLEDWLFAPGYYLCVFFWSLAFIFVDQVQLLTIADARRAYYWNAAPLRQGFHNVAPSR
jgi:O-antigen ligase